MPKQDCPFVGVCRNIKCQAVVSDETCTRAIEASRRVPLSGIPDTMFPTTDLKLAFPATMISDEAYECMMRPMTFANEGKHLYLWSENPGTGKTTMACMLALRYELMAASEWGNPMTVPYPTELSIPRTLFLNTSHFLNGLKRSMSTGRTELLDLLDRQMDRETAAKIMILDDIGTEAGSKWEQGQLYDLIDFRISNGLSIVFTSNKKPADLPLSDKVKSRISKAIVSEMKVEIELRGEDW